MPESKPSQSAEPKAAKYVQNPAFDEFAISLTVMAAVIERTARLLDSALSNASRRPVRDPNFYAAGFRAAEQLSRIIAADRELSLDEKWLLQDAFHKWAGFLEQNGSLWSRYVYPNVQIANQVIGSGYVGAHGYSDPTWKADAEIALNFIRFLQRHGDDTLRQQLRALSANLWLYRPGTLASVECLVDPRGEAFVLGGVQRPA